ncbi:magnesium transporter [Sneathiella sp. HT1-7]|uniref:magnesium transporter n=1 Tax=Sneathiella sp. HT1-7 TaxID=2887192 RepID=UPI001D1515F2|nr:magnesium transporter [Sneathiella sp. HT1-7]MCC3305079.1 magnesium transporter [Sneathiella sp. HT1-7]
MTGNIDAAIEPLERRFLLDHPWDAARLLESLPVEEAAIALTRQRVEVLVPVWRRLITPVATRLLSKLPDKRATELLSELLPNEAALLLASLPESDRDRYLSQLDVRVSEDLKKLISYPEGSAGRLMNPLDATFRMTTTASEAINQLRERRTKNSRSLFLVDEENRLTEKVSIQDIAIANADERLQDLAHPVTAYVNPLSSQDEVVELLERDRLADLPVVDLNGVLIGIVQHTALVDTIQEDATADIQTMVGASKDERALSKPLFAVRRRLPWLQINLLTAFMAAAVVGLFENTIAQFTALAVLLPVVAGQSGNAGAQALAVTMRGLALREISTSQGLRVMFKELNVGLVNGLAVAVTCGIGVFFWSGSLGLVLVIMLSMVLAMVAAGFAGAVVPIVLTKLGQDPAVASSIVLTTVTDIAGFFSFLGIATLLSSML